MSRFIKQGGAYGYTKPSTASALNAEGMNSRQARGGQVQGSRGSKSLTSTKYNERDYFDDDDDDDALVNPTAPAASNPSGLKEEEEEEVDPLEAFMAGIDQQVQKESSMSAAGLGTRQSLPEIVSGLDAEDSEGEKEVNTHAYAASAGSGYNKVDEYTADEDYASSEKRGSNSSGVNTSKEPIEPLPVIDHTSIAYPSFRRAFYTPCQEIVAMTAAEVSAYLEEIHVYVTPYSAPRPVSSFSQCGFNNVLMEQIRTQGYQQPTAIQAQTLPASLSGYDVIGLAKTGSGKTLAYVWPMIVHILDQPQMQVGQGPIGLVLAPTRELVAQIHNESRKFAKPFNIRSVAITGGGGKWEMTKALKNETPEMVIATPGRLIEMIRTKVTNLQRVTMVVLDEADRMFDMGFEYQMRSIVQNVRPDRQMLIFSATMKKKVEGFARELIDTANSVRITVGQPGQANSDIVQRAVLIQRPTTLASTTMSATNSTSTSNSDHSTGSNVDAAYEEAKWLWLRGEIDLFASEGKVLIFVLSKQGTEALTAKLQQWFASRQLSISVDCLHGDKDQALRMGIMQKFRKADRDSTKALTILVATDIASRGLDIKDIRTVINYDVSKNIETYVHRIGRTGRLGVEGVTPGIAYTLLTPMDAAFAVDLVQNLNLSGQEVSAELLVLAKKDAKWHRVKHIPPGGGGVGGGHRAQKHSSSSSGGGVGRGLGYGAAFVPATSAAVAAVSGGKNFAASDLVHKSNINNNNNTNGSQPPPVVMQQQQLQQQQGKRKSRFGSEAPQHIQVSIPQQQQQAHHSHTAAAAAAAAPTASVLSGFVRASSSSSSSSSNPISSSSSLSTTTSTTTTTSRTNSTTDRNDSVPLQQRKRSRWDTS